MKNLSSVAAVIVNMEILDKLANYWYLLVFIINVIIFVVGVIQDFKKTGKFNVLNLEHIEELEKFGEDLRKYYERNNSGTNQNKG